MQREGGVEIGFGRLHLHRDGDGLDDFGGGVADDVTADHAILAMASFRVPKGPCKTPNLHATRLVVAKDGG
jgi:hypothetical protein